MTRCIRLCKGKLESKPVVKEPVWRIEILNNYSICPEAIHKDRLPIYFCLSYKSVASLVAQLVKNQPTMKKTWVQSWLGKIPWRRKRLPTPVFCPGEPHELYSPWGCKESDVTFTFTFPQPGLPGRVQVEIPHWRALPSQSLQIFLEPHGLFFKNFGCACGI